MDVERFASSPIGTLEPITIDFRGSTIGHFAFVPAPLSAEISLSEEEHLAVSKADQALGILEGVAGTLPSKQLLIRPLIRREAVSTSALEGTYAGLSEVLEAEAADPSRAGSEVREVLNYIRTAEQALTAIETRPISINLIKDLHRTLMTETRGDTQEAGGLRTIPVMIGPEGASPTDAHFIPPPPGTVMRELLEDWEEWNYREDHISSVVRTAVSHYQFETIHPFRDGNGRIGRLIAVLLLIELGPLSGHLLSLSPYFEARRALYGEHLRDVSATGDFGPWVAFFADAVASEAAEARRTVDRLLAWRQMNVERLRDMGLKGVVIALAESLIGFPVVTAPISANRLSVTYRSANRAIRILTDAGVLEEITGRRYGRIFVAREVIEILNV